MESLKYSMPFLPFLHAVAERRDLSAAEAEQAMSEILEGETSTPQIAAFLVALRMKGETAAELAGFARAMRARVTRVDAGGGVVLDTCGTGGDGAGTFNVSTIAALVAAGAGVKVAKHGNRSISSRSGSADVLEALGVRVQTAAADMSRALHEIGIAFLFAPALHPAMKHAQPARLELKMRTVFNLLGPLANPAGATAQLIGAPSEKTAALMAEAAAQIGGVRGYVVHGEGGLDEVSTIGETVVFEIGRGSLRWTPEDFGVGRARLEELRGEDAATNARIAREVLDGRPGPARDLVLVNATAALMAAGVENAMEAARESIDTGAARGKLDQLVEITNRPLG
ncbi:MAG: anthranilate phosphoribosyltransferase [Bryobacteraceae bacterium]